MNTLVDSWANCTPDGNPPVVGETYQINHTRKGSFKGRVISADDTTWAEVLIVQGRANAILSYNERECGERVTVRSTLCTMTPLPPAKKRRAAK